jgi:hypothetical protein
LKPTKPRHGLERRLKSSEFNLIATKLAAIFLVIPALGSCVTVTSPKDSGRAAARSVQPAHPSYMARLRSAEKALGEDFMFKLRAANETDAVSMVRAKQIELDEWALVLSYVGDTTLSTEIFSHLAKVRGRMPRGEGAADLPADAVGRDALETIVEAAGSKRIVILNESHHAPLHRAFALRLALELRKIGFTHLASETLSDSPRASSISSISQQTGYYSDEPVFGEFLRTALNVGYQLVPYEHIPNQSLPIQARMAAREEGQARNIYERVLSKDKSSKLLVYVGYGHLRERLVSKTDPRQMATYLAELSGEDPLTVDQTTMVETPAAHPRLAAFNQAVQMTQSRGPVVMFEKSGTPLIRGHYSGAIDLQVIHPPVALKDGRPTWYSTLAQRREMEVPRDLWPTSGRRLIQAFHENDGPTAVPVDMVLLQTGKPIPRLMLPKGNYKIAFEDE